MSVLNDIRSWVDQVAADRNLAPDRAFGYWFLEEFEDLSSEEAEIAIVDGPWDGGRDAVYLDEDNQVLKIFQFKYSENRTYVAQAFTDLQNAIANEQENLQRSRDVLLYVVTIASGDQELREAARNALRRIRTWLTRNHIRVDVDIELFDLKKFAQLFERLYGVDLEIKFIKPPIRVNGALLGLLDASNLAPHVARDELFAFNIRKFLGLRKRSVSWEMNESLEDEEKRPRFWALNNGIVCLCTNQQPRG